MSDRLAGLGVCVGAAESGSFSHAGRELGLSQPSVSRTIGELEARLGVTLLLRTTRRITVTDAGALFLDRAREILAEMEEAEDAARGLDSLRGLIRLALPVVYGTREIIPLLPKFLAPHPHQFRSRRFGQRHDGPRDRNGIDRDGGAGNQAGPAGAGAARLQAAAGRGTRSVSRRPAPVGQGARAGRLSRRRTQIENLLK